MLIRRTVRAVLLPLVLAWAAAPLLAGDSLAKPFKAASKLELKQLRADGKLALKTVQAALVEAPKAYADLELSAGGAVALAVQAVTFQREAIENAAVSAAENLRAAGVELLAGPDEGAPLPGLDFVAGGRGVWDAHLASIETELDKLDSKLDARLRQFMRRMQKRAEKLEQPFDMRYRLPAHGAAYQHVSSPGAGEAQGSSLELAPAHIAMAVRFLSIGHDDTLELGVQLSATATQARVAGETGLGAQVADFSELAGAAQVSIQDVDHLIPDDSSFLVLTLTAEEPLALYDTLVLSDPELDTDAAALKPVIKGLRSSGKQQTARFAKQSKAVVKALAKQLALHLKAYKAGELDAYTAMKLAFSELRFARAGLGVGRLVSVNSIVTQAQGALADAGVLSDADLPRDLHVDAGGVYSDISRRLLKREARSQGSITKSFQNFAKQLMKLVAKQGEPVAAAIVVGRQQPPCLPMITVSNALLGLEELVSGHLTDVLLFERATTAPGEFPLVGEVIGAVDLTRSASLSATLTNGLNPPLDLFGLTGGIGWVTQAELPTLTNLPLLGRQLRAGNSAEERHSAILVVTPTVLISAGG